MTFAKRLRSTTWRLTLTLALIQIVTLALGLGAMFVLTRQTLANDAQIAAEVAASDLLDQWRTGGNAVLIRAVNDRLRTSEDRHLVVLLRGANGTRLAGNLAAWPVGSVAMGRWTLGNLIRSGGAGNPQLASYLIQPLPGGQSLLTGEVMRDQEQLTRASEKSFVYAMFAGLVAAALASWTILRVLELRVDHFSHAALDIASGRLHTRIDLHAEGDAFERLGIAINAMLERIEALVSELRVVTDSMAHDLRSPVARIRSALERSFETASDPASRGALADAIDETDSLQRLLDTALEISRSEAGIGRSQFAAFDLAPMLYDLAEVYGPLAEDGGFEITVSAPATMPMTAHRELLFRAICNLIDNSLKYAVGGSDILLDLVSGADDRVVLTVSDNGPGIEPADREEAMRRFGRLDAARSHSGAGLGMALVTTIATLHGGTIELGETMPHGLRVKLILPK